MGKSNILDFVAAKRKRDNRLNAITESIPPIDIDTMPENYKMAVYTGIALMQSIPELITLVPLHREVSKNDDISNVTDPADLFTQVQMMGKQCYVFGFESTNYRYSAAGRQVNLNSAIIKHPELFVTNEIVHMMLNREKGFNAYITRLIVRE